MATRRRSNGEGSYWQLPDKTWVHQITIGRKPNGALERKSFKGRTKAICKQRKEEWLAEQAAAKEQEAQDAQKELEHQEQFLRRGHSIESEELFESVFMEWLKLYKSPPTRKPSTYASYIDTYNTHFAEAFGQMPLYAITQDVVQDYYQKKQLNGARRDGKPGGLSAKTIRNHHMILKDFFSYAQKKYKLSENPTLETARPEVVAKEMRVLSPDEMQIFIEEVMRETQRIAILTDLFVGFRVGELLALDIADFNLERQTITVNKNLIRVSTVALSLDNPNIKILNYDPSKKTHLVIQSTPKTKSSNREIAISDGLCELLVRHIFTMAHSSWPNPNNLLFPSKAGTYIDPKSFEIRLKAVSKRCEIKKVNPHALRHTLATRLVEEQTPLNIVQGILGHSSLETTRKYLHKNDDVERGAIETMSNYLDIEKLTAAPRLNGAKKRSKFAGIVLPDFSVQTAGSSK
ncbi:Tyrosine recombinase XerD [uncultured Flavonifractor sp.]|nr:site-specific recombinase XerD [Flavonifractor plautii]SCJ57928.1 Tyrosine recombinase XerD [uncultured Flavonifractor sp.]